MGAQAFNIKVMEPRPVGEQQASANWRVVQIRGEEELEPTTVNVFAAQIDPKIANSLIRHFCIRGHHFMENGFDGFQSTTIMWTWTGNCSRKRTTQLYCIVGRELNSKAPLPLLGHVKRVRRSKTEGMLDLSIILCTDGRVELGDEIVLPSAVSEIAARYCLQPFVAMVPGQAARSREEWETQSQLWPTSYHPNSGKSAANAEISQADADTMCYFMEKAIEQAREARRLGQLANGAVIVDPALGAVVARGCDGTATWCGSLCSVSRNSLSGSQSEEKPEILPSEECRPLQHAIMDAIQMAAERERRLWPPANDAKATMQENRVESDCSSVVSCKRQRRSSDDTQAGRTMVGSEMSPPPQHPEVPGEASSLEISRPYLCTNFDLYVTREPCTMCAMAMVHQRIRRVIYGIPNALVGALGSRYKLHGLPSLNHHYTVFQVSLTEEDLL